MNNKYFHNIAISLLLVRSISDRSGHTVVYFNGALVAALVLKDTAVIVMTEVTAETWSVPNF